MPQTYIRLVCGLNEAADHSLRLWVLLQLEMWHREVADSTSAVVRPAA